MRVIYRESLRLAPSPCPLRTRQPECPFFKYYNKATFILMKLSLSSSHDCEPLELAEIDALARLWLLLRGKI